MKGAMRAFLAAAFALAASAAALVFVRAHRGKGPTHAAPALAPGRRNAPERHLAPGRHGQPGKASPRDPFAPGPGRDGGRARSLPRAGKRAWEVIPRLVVLGSGDAFSS